LVKEHKKPKPNAKVLKELQALTFTKRKKAIQNVEGEDVLAEVLKQFPFLDNEHTVSKSHITLNHNKKN